MNSLKLSIGLALSLALTAPALAAHEWLPAEQGDTWTFVTTADVSVHGVGDGSRDRVSVDQAAGAWRHFTDFAGLGPLWIHAGTDERIYMWNGASAELLIDFAGPAGFPHERSVVLPDGRIIEVGLESTDTTEIATRSGTFDCKTLSIRFTGANDLLSRRVHFARNRGIVRWDDDFLGYSWGLYLLWVAHEVEPDLEPVALNVDANDAVRFGNTLLLATPDGLTEFDLESRRVTRRVALPGHTFGLSWRNNPFRLNTRGTAFGWDDANEGVAHFVNLTNGTVASSARPGLRDIVDTTPLASQLVLTDHGLETRNYRGDATALPLPAGQPATQLVEHDGRTYLSMAYPHALVVIEGNKILETISSPKPIYGFVIDARTAYATTGTGLMAIDLDTHVTADLGSQNPGRSLVLRNGRLYGITSGGTVIETELQSGSQKTIGLGQRVYLTHPYGFSGQIVDAQDRRALVRVPRVGVFTVDFR